MLSEPIDLLDMGEKPGQSLFSTSQLRSCEREVATFCTFLLLVGSPLMIEADPTFRLPFAEAAVLIAAVDESTGDPAAG